MEKKKIIMFFDKRDIIAEKEYVLTPGFAAKLFAIHSRITAGQNIILSGDTVCLFKKICRKK